MLKNYLLAIEVRACVCVCVCVCVCARALSHFNCVQLFVTLWTSLTGSSVDGIVQAGILEWVAMSSWFLNSRAEALWMAFLFSINTHDFTYHLYGDNPKFSTQTFPLYSKPTSSYLLDILNEKTTSIFIYMSKINHWFFFPTSLLLWLHIHALHWP